MPRYAYQLRIKPGKEAEYDEAHRHVWPELLAKLKQVGYSNYSIFRRGLELVLVMEIDDLETAWEALSSEPISPKWEKQMSLIFDAMPPTNPTERFPMMNEVFHLE